ncbi:FAD-dependent oxidoreductase [Dactylosporangium sp. NPDC051541]|uniref:FAD-dependent oxidoreductase n=1 Tax=Dactylosporangium sp. NPDC051541 TaxID=3363977 RepID=UPI0037BCD75F
MSPHRSVLVVGAGVSGMTSAIRLAESGFTVEVVTRDDPDQTTSCAAGALWGPYLADDQRILHWSLRTFHKLDELAQEHSPTGVRLTLGLEAAREPAPVPTWAPPLPGFRIAKREELGEFSNGWWYQAPLVDMPAYLKFLQAQMADLGIAIKIREVAALDADLAAGRPVVNCTGLGAGPLTGDTALFPVRGQLVVVPNPGLDQFFADHDETPEPTYLLPHGDLLVLGGTIRPRVADTTPDPVAAERIIDRCAQIDGRVRGLPVLEHRVGLRPARPRIRLERELTADGVHIVHNYGHGGAGVTVSWGCADDVVELVREIG